MLVTMLRYAQTALGVVQFSTCCVCQLSLVFWSARYAKPYGTLGDRLTSYENCPFAPASAWYSRPRPNCEPTCGHVNTKHQALNLLCNTSKNPAILFTNAAAGHPVQGRLVHLSCALYELLLGHRCCWQQLWVL